MAGAGGGQPQAREGDWQCVNTDCGNHTQYPSNFVFASKVNCPKCGTGKTAKKAGDWCCPNLECINHTNTVYARKPSCSKCGAHKPVRGNAGGAFGGMNFAMMGQLVNMQSMQALPGGGGGGRNAREGDWHCPNAECKNHRGNVVFAAKTSCPLCRSPKPAMPTMALAVPQMHFSGAMQPQQFSGYDQQQHYGQYAALMGQQDGARGGGKGGRPGDWHCSNPDCKNHTENFVFANKMYCTLCNTPKPAMPSTSMVGNPYSNGASDPYSNPYANTHSNGGGNPYSNAGQQYAHRGNQSSRVVRAGDWQCPNPSCRNHSNLVYGSKPSCTICGTANPTLTSGSGGARERSRSPRMQMMQQQM